MRWLPSTAFPIANRRAQTSCALISRRSWRGRAAKITYDFIPRCCYHALVLLVAATSRRTKMSVYKRGTHWHYRFRLRGVRYRGSLPEARTKFMAEQAEVKLKQSV